MYEDVGMNLSDLNQQFAANQTIFRDARKASWGEFGGIKSHHDAMMQVASARIAELTREINALGHFVEGQRVTTSGFSGSIARQYSENMYEVRLCKGVTCVPHCDIKLA